ncbi:hypothetical protein [Larkinella soli]|uniref:hypothetical protein n=1 Tax=Larkinella soli TaxID=1770527 RepID=UPI000FFB4B21|nr:hypothetical protein [Larkinella soli]
MERNVERNIRHLATRDELFNVREDLLREVASAKSDLSKTVSLVGLLQFLGIVGSILAILSFLTK